MSWLTTWSSAKHKCRDVVGVLSNGVRVFRKIAWQHRCQRMFVSFVDTNHKQPVNTCNHTHHRRELGEGVSAYLNYMWVVTFLGEPRCTQRSILFLRVSVGNIIFGVRKDAVHVLHDTFVCEQAQQRRHRRGFQLHPRHTSVLATDDTRQHMHCWYVWDINRNTIMGRIFEPRVMTGRARVTAFGGYHFHVQCAFVVHNGVPTFQKFQYIFIWYALHEMVHQSDAGSHRLGVCVVIQLPKRALQDGTEPFHLPIALLSVLPVGWRCFAFARIRCRLHNCLRFCVYLEKVFCK